MDACVCVLFDNTQTLFTFVIVESQDLKQYKRCSTKNQQQQQHQQSVRALFDSSQMVLFKEIVSGCKRLIQNTVEIYSVD